MSSTKCNSFLVLLKSILCWGIFIALHFNCCFTLFHFKLGYLFKIQINLNLNSKKKRKRKGKRKEINITFFFWIKTNNILKWIVYLCFNNCNHVTSSHIFNFWSIQSILYWRNIHLLVHFNSCFKLLYLKLEYLFYLFFFWSSS